MSERSSSASECDQVVETIIALTHLTHFTRAIIAGEQNSELYLALRRRGFRIGFPSATRLRKDGCAVGVITAHDSLSEFQTALTQVASGLEDAATIAVVIKSDGSGFALKIRNLLQHFGFRIDAGVRCHQGLVLCACRQGLAEVEHAA